jgi:hypothetical protein
MPFGQIGSAGFDSVNYTAARAALLDRLALLEAGGAGELTIAGAALIPRLALLAAGGAGELTAARAANLSNLDALISNRLGKINSIQTGAITIPNTATSATATVTAVVIARCLLLHLGERSDQAALPRVLATLDLTNTTTITAERGDTSSTTIVRFMLIEFTA